MQQQMQTTDKSCLIKATGWKILAHLYLGSHLTKIFKKHPGGIKYALPFRDY